MDCLFCLIETYINICVLLLLVMTTIVTAYFQLPKSKASHSTYVKWMQNMLKIQNPMVIFCDEQSRTMIQSMRGDAVTKIIVTRFEEFHSFQYVNAFLEHSKMDREVAIGHNIFLYMIWSEKSHFLKRVIEMNPFSSSYFLWVDIGCFRRPNVDYLQWPNPARIAAMPIDKVLLLSVYPFTDGELCISKKEELPSFQYENRIGAPIFGGGADILLQWHDKYFEMLEYFISIGRFIGKDQSIMNSVYLTNQSMCELVKWKRPCHDMWFYLQEYLA